MSNRVAAAYTTSGLSPQSNHLQLEEATNRIRADLWVMLASLDRVQDRFV